MLSIKNKKEGKKEKSILYKKFKKKKNTYRYIKRNITKEKKVYLTVYGKEEEQKWEVYHWRQIQVDAMDNPNREIQQQ